MQTQRVLIQALEPINRESSRAIIVEAYAIPLIAESAPSKSICFEDVENIGISAICDKVRRLIFFGIISPLFFSRSFFSQGKFLTRLKGHFCFSQDSVAFEEMIIFENSQNCFIHVCFFIVLS